jgi:hypothetical protein
MSTPTFSYSDERGNEFSFVCDGVQKHCTIPATADLTIISSYMSKMSLRELYEMDMPDYFIDSHIRAMTMAMVSGTEYRGPEVYYILGTLPDRRILFWIGNEENAMGLRRAMRRCCQKIAEAV